MDSPAGIIRTSTSQQQQQSAHYNNNNQNQNNLNTNITIGNAVGGGGPLISHHQHQQHLINQAAAVAAIGNSLPPHSLSNAHHQLSQLCNPAGPQLKGTSNNNNNNNNSSSSNTTTTTSSNSHANNHQHHHHQYPLLALQQNFSHLLPPNSYAAAAVAAAAVANESANNQHQQHHQTQALHHHNQQQQQQQHRRYHNNNNNHAQQQQQISQQQHNSQHHLNHPTHHHNHHHHHHHHRYNDIEQQLHQHEPRNGSSSAGGSAANNSNNIMNPSHHNHHLLHLGGTGSSNSSGANGIANHNSRGHHHNWRQGHRSQNLCLPSKQQSSCQQQSDVATSGSATNLKQNGTPHSLLDLSAKIVAEHVPFQSIEQRYEHIPEPVQRRIIFWSFPRHEEDIKMYSSLSSESSYGAVTGPVGNGTLSSNSTTITSSNNNHNHSLSYHPLSPSNNAYPWMDQQQPANNLSNAQQQHQTTSHSSSSSSSKNNHANKQLTFHKGLRLYNDGCVQDVLQVGFNLSGLVVVKNMTTMPGNSVAKTRGLNNNNIIVAPTVADILNNQNQPSTSGADSSASLETLSSRTHRVSVTFDRCKITSVSCSCELQDIFWCEHVVALTVYRIRNPETIDLRVPISETLLSLDRQQLQKLVQYIIAEHHTEVLPTAQRLLDEMCQSLSEINKIHGAPDPTAGASTTDEHIWHLDESQVNEKVQNYLTNTSKDAPKQIQALFEKIREMFQAKDSNGTRLLRLITEQFLVHATRNEKSRPLWDQLVSLWVIVMLNPDLTDSGRDSYTQLLIDWSKVPKCPKEDVERRISLKRKATELSDDEDDYPTSYNEVPLNQSNNYPAHMATHRHRTFQPNNSFQVLRPYNQLPILPGSCPCQISNSFVKKMRSHRHPLHENESYASVSKRPLNSSLNPHQNDSRAQSSGAENRLAVPHEPRSVFYRALDSKELTWNDPHLQLILNKDGPIDYEGSQKSQLFDFTGNPLWSEAVSEAAARVETLRSHGYKEQALRLTVATVRELKLHQDKWCVAASSDIEHSCSSRSADTYSEGWIGHPFDPINVLMNILLEASSTEVASDIHGSSFNANLCSVNSSRCSCPYNQALADFTHRLLPDLASLSSYHHRVDGLPILPLVNLAPRRAPNLPSQNSAEKTPYFHVPVPGCCQKDSYLTLAVEIALISLGQQRSILTIPTSHERAVRQEAEIIAKLESIDTSDPLLIDVLKHQATLLLGGGPFQSSCCGVPTDSAPLHTFARYLFDALSSHYRPLAYKVGIYALKQPLVFDENAENYGAARTNGRSSNLNHLQKEQLSLAQTMLSKSKDDGSQGSYLGKVYRASIKNIRNPASLMKLSKDTQKEAKASGGAPHQALLDTAFNLGLQVLKMTLSPHTPGYRTRVDFIGTVAECATDIGLEAVLRLMRDSREYFSASEALNLIVNRKEEVVRSAERSKPQEPLRTLAICKLKLKDNPVKEAELNRISRELALDCATRDPTNCALEALEFCENDDESLRRALKIVIDAGTNGTMDSTQLIKVADHIDKGLAMTDKAFEIAMVAVRSLSIPSNSDSTSPKKDDLMRACEYAKKVNGFGTLIPLLINNIECATILSEIYNTFSPNQLYGRNYGNELLLAYRHTGDLIKSINMDLYHQREDAKCWDALLKRTLKAFVDTTRVRLQNISPRHYSEFISFLVKAFEIFEKATDGPQQFKDLIQEIMKSYRTKKKLMERLREQFNFSIRPSL